MKGRVLVYSIVGCPHCKAAKALLTNKGIPYTEVSIDKYDSSVRQEVRGRTGKSLVPQIFFNAQHIGGNAELQKLAQDESLWAEAIKSLNETEPGADAPPIPDDSLLLPDSEKNSAGFECEPDEYAKLVQQMKDCGLIKNHRKGLFTYKNTFTGNEFISWMKKEHNSDEKVAVEKGQYLIDNHFAHKVKTGNVFENSDKLYRLLEDDDSNALNHGDTSSCEAKSVNELGEDLRKLILSIYNEYLSSDGKRVDYDGIAKSADFETYIKMTMLLHRVKVEDASREEKLAFFINVYNALVIHANVMNGPPSNVFQRYKFFNNVKYIIGGQSYSLQDIENGVLRSNRRGVAMMFKPFGKDDPRLKVALKSHEPLIHFALVCGAKSCPPIKTYSFDGVMDQLKLAAESFLEADDGCLVSTESSTISLSKIFSWYKEDFGGSNESLIEWVVQNMADGNKKSAIISLKNQGKYKVQFLPYDWGTNS